MLVLADEPAQWPESTGEWIRAALKTAAGKQPHPRFTALGTGPADPEHWFAEMLAGGADYAQRHAARNGDPKFQKRTWLKANPSMRHMPDLEIAIRMEAKQAKADPALLAAFNAKTASVAGQHMEGLIQRSITELRYPENATITVEGGWMRSPSGKPFYVKGKKSNNPLIDTGVMRQSVTYKVEDWRLSGIARERFVFNREGEWCSFGLSEPAAESE